MNFSDTFFIAIGVGGGLGLILSFLYWFFNKSSSNNLVRTIFGISTYSFLNAITLTLASILLVVLAVVAGIVRDGEYPYKNPIHFTLEVLASAFVPALLFLGIAWSRGNLKSFNTLEKFLIIVLKFALTTVLLQYSGYFSHVFP